MRLLSFILLVVLGGCVLYPDGNRIQIRTLDPVEGRLEAAIEVLTVFSSFLQSQGFESRPDHSLGDDFSMSRVESGGLIHCSGSITRQGVVAIQCTESWRPWFWQPTQLSGDLQGLESEIITRLSEIGEVQARRLYFTNDEEIILGPEEWILTY